MKPDPNTPPQSSAYAAGQRAFRAGKRIDENPISGRRLNAVTPLRSWWEEGWRDAQHLAAEEQTP